MGLGPSVRSVFSRPGAIFPGLLALLLVLAAGAPAAGQAVSGRVLEEGTGEPVEGAMVRLLAGDGGEVAATFTDARGEYRLKAPEAGDYRLRVSRIGFGSWEGEPLRLTPGEGREQEVLLAPHAVSLSAISATSRRRCESSPEAGMATYRLWRETRKALEAAQWTEDRGALELRTRTFRRKLDRNLRVEEVLEEQRQVGYGVSPYQSLPAERLSEQGYVERVGEHFLYYGPDADVLLSEAFQRDHCFWITRDGSPQFGWVGLAFKPVKGRKVPEIEGVLWLEEGTSELKRLEFRYVNMDLPSSYHEGGGRVDFFRLPSGPWIVRSWSLRMPLMARDRLRIEGYVRDEYEVAGYEEEGAQVRYIATAEGRTLYDFEQATLAGTAWDSISGAPLEGARVELVGTGRSVETDVRGRFRIPGVEEGRFTLRLRDDRLTSWGLEPPFRTVEVTPGELVEVDLSTPGPATVARALCPEAGAGTAALTGRVRLEDEGPLPGATVAAVWPDPELRERYVHRETETDERGRYVLCGVPAGAQVAVRAARDGEVSEAHRLAMAGRGLASRDLTLAPGTEADRLAAVIREQGLGGGEPGLEGRGVIRGTVLEAGDDESPLAAAEVRLGDERVAVTDSAGRFTLAEIPAGTHPVQVRYLGFESQEALVRVLPGDTVRSVVTLETDPVPLPELAVRVEGTPYPARMAGLVQRVERGSGHLVTRDDIEATPGNRLSDVLRKVPGVRVVPCPGGGGGCTTIEVGRSGAGRLSLASSRGRVGLGQGGNQGETQTSTPGGGSISIPGVGGVPNPAEADRAQYCGVDFYLDGAPIDLVVSDPNDPTAVASGGLDQIPADQVEAVEVYTGVASIPARFKRQSGCTRAVVVIWTR